MRVINLGPHIRSIKSCHRHLCGVLMPLIRIFYTSEDVSYVSSPLSGAEILGVYPNCALREAKVT